MENLFRRETEALRIIEKEIVQLVWADQILRSLLNFALVRRRQKLGGNGRCENVGQNFANLAADAVNGGFTSREVERTIRAIRLAFKAKDAHTDDPYYADLAARAVDMLRRMAAYETKGAAND